jgi:hypothetical protein
LFALKFYQNSSVSVELLSLWNKKQMFQFSANVISVSFIYNCVGVNVWMLAVIFVVSLVLTFFLTNKPQRFTINSIHLPRSYIINQNAAKLSISEHSSESMALTKTLDLLGFSSCFQS